ncbi:MAG: MinD/ParA family protein [Synergistaceae bacterium]|jgi:flagellar biosynthesis protein FlhG|nr:MinD/ParA family protein [Synergistaceae bacterium]
MSRTDMAFSDQARELRRIVELQRQENRPGGGNMRTFAVLSGKGGVGKSNLSLNLACALAEQEQRVVILDADLGLANIDMLCGITARYNLAHLIDGSRGMDDVLVEFAPNIQILPGGSGIRELADLDEAHLAELIETLAVLEDRADILIVDTGAGIHRGVLAFASAADTTILITTPEPTSIRDAYGVLKALRSSPAVGGKTDIAFVVNMTNSEAEGLEVANRIRMAANRFLGLSIHYMGCILNDDMVGKAVRIRKPFYQLYPASRASECIRKLGYALTGASDKGIMNTSPARGLKAFFFRLTRGRFMER